MATSLPSFKPHLTIRASRKPDPNRPKPVSTNWWAPLFGHPLEPGRAASAATVSPGGGDRPEMPDEEAQKARPGSRFAPGCFTEEKARQLRRKTRDGSSFHDAMYHSAIATRLTSDRLGPVPTRSGED